MTYFGFLARFLLIPIVALLIVAWFDRRRALPGFDARLVPRVILIHILLALAYTTPWDNYLVASGVWTYNPGLVTGIVLGYVPLEEYTFFVLETLLAGLWWWALARRLPAAGEFKPSARGRWIAFGVLLGLWSLMTVLLFLGPDSWNYLAITLFWALPAIFPQMLFGADILWHHRRLLAATILPLGLYLSLMDIVALRAGTWAISSQQTTGLLFFGILPLEEVIFFFVTNILIGFGMTLMLSAEGWKRVRDWQARRFRGLP